MNETTDVSPAQPRRVLITGGLGGIGLACAECFAEAGDHVIVTSRDADRLSAIDDRVRASGGRIEGVLASLADAADIRALVDKLGAPDVLVNNAGLNRPAPFLDVAVEDFDAIFSVNVRSLFVLTQAVAAAMIAAGKPGAIVNISSQAGFVGLPERSVYCASKHAVEGFTKAVAVDLKGQGVRINTVAPTFIETDMTRATLARDDFQARIRDRLLLEALPTLTDVANAVWFLASPLAAGTTGTTLKVDGGWTAH